MSPLRRLFCWTHLVLRLLLCKCSQWILWQLAECAHFAGLDARAAVIVMHAVKNISKGGRTVLVTIHQPSIGGMSVQRFARCSVS